MSTQRERCCTELTEVDGNLADRLHGIDVKWHVVLIAKSRERHQVLHNSRFIVSKDDRCQFQVIDRQ